MYKPNPPPPVEPESKKIGFIAPFFASAEISKTINMLSKYAYETTNVNILPNCLLQGWNLTQSWRKCSQTIWQHSSAQVILAGKIYIAPNFVCLFEPIKCKHVKLRFFATFGTCYSSQMPSSRLKCGKKLRNTSPVGVSADQHRTAQVIVTGKICRVLHVNFESLFWPIKCMHSKPRFWVHFSHVFTS